VSLRGKESFATKEVFGLTLIEAIMAVHCSTSLLQFFEHALLTLGALILSLNGHDIAYLLLGCLRML
jgi:hypothetical protein